MMIIRRAEVKRVLAGREQEIIDLVGQAYRLHEEGQTVVPHSVFLRLPAGLAGTESPNRIIGLPAYLGGAEPVAGFKWVSSFPGNLRHGLERANAVIVTNSAKTGRPDALIEGALISAARTGASAALAARVLVPGSGATGVALIGCGVINFAVLRHLAVAQPDLAEVTLYDLDLARANGFAAQCAQALPHLKVAIADGAAQAIGAHPLISLATTATTPYLSLDGCQPGSVVLHVSLRDVLPETIVDSVNVVDDADHVCRERTSLHLAEQLTGGRDLIAASVGQLLRGERALPDNPERTVVFSPFGLGALDLALARFVRDEARRGGDGILVEDFFTTD
jgi:ornithine cyclodeaminase